MPFYPKIRTPSAPQLDIEGRLLNLPADREIWGIMYAALAELADPRNYEQDEALTPVEVASIFAQALQDLGPLPPPDLLVTDDFTGPNGQALVTHNNAWQMKNGALYIQSNTIRGNTANTGNIAAWTADTFDPDQSAQISLVSRVTNGLGGPIVRCLSNTNFCAAIADTTGLYLFEIVAGDDALLGSAAAPANGDVIQLTAAAGNYAVYVNDVLQISAAATLTTGQPGIYVYNNLSTSIDNFEATNL